MCVLCLAQTERTNIKVHALMGTPTPLGTAKNHAEKLMVNLHTFKYIIY